MGKPFFVKDCALAVISTGEAAGSLIEFKEVLARVPTSSLYFHFWGRHFRSSIAHPELHNDFARWAYLHMHDHVLAERLGIVAPTDFSGLEDIREALLEIIEQRLDETAHLLTTTRENKFHFLRSVIIIYDTTTIISTPTDLKSVLPTLSTTSLFYHFIDARRRTTTGRDDFSSWLAEEGIDGELLLKIQHLDPYFLSLTEQREKLTEIMVNYFE